MQRKNLFAIFILVCYGSLLSCSEEGPEQAAQPASPSSQQQSQQATPRNQPTGVPTGARPTRSPAPPERPAAIQIQETNAPGIVAELTECKRKQGVLTVKVRFRNTSESRTYFTIDTHHGVYAGFYVTAGSKKYFILKDSEGEPLAPGELGGGNLEENQTHLWWAKFPAPPPDVKTINLIIPTVLPFEDVPITDS